MLTFVVDRTVLKLVDSVWSTSDSSRAAAGVSGGGPIIWFFWGDVSRSQRTLYVFALFNWWSPRTIVFQTRSFVIWVPFRSCRAGMLMMFGRSIEKRSRLPKKWILSFTIGPPTVPPHR